MKLNTLTDLRGVCWAPDPELTLHRYPAACTALTLWEDGSKLLKIHSLNKLKVGSSEKEIIEPEIFIKTEPKIILLLKIGAKQPG